MGHFSMKNFLGIRTLKRDSFSFPEFFFVTAFQKSIHYTIIKYFLINNTCTIFFTISGILFRLGKLYLQIAENTFAGNLESTYFYGGLCLKSSTKESDMKKKLVYF